MAEPTRSSPRTSAPDLDPHAQALVSPPASRLRWVADDPGPRRLCTAHPVGAPLVFGGVRRRACWVGGSPGAEHAVHPGADHTLCGRNVDHMLHGSEAHPRDGRRLTVRPSWPPASRCVECTRRLATMHVLLARRLPGSRYQQVCAACRYTLPPEARWPMAGIRASWVLAMLAPEVGEVPEHETGEVAA
jgi:hypothetical protein